MRGHESIRNRAAVTTGGPGSRRAAPTRSGLRVVLLAAALSVVLIAAWSTPAVRAQTSTAESATVATSWVGISAADFQAARRLRPDPRRYGVAMDAAAYDAYLASTGDEPFFSAEEFEAARRLRSDPRNYGVRMDVAEYIVYLVTNGTR